MQSNLQSWMEHDENNLAIQTLNKYYYENVIKPYLESEKIIDLHAHTNFSDGELSPIELVRLAIKQRLSALAITDHDTIRGIKSLDKNDQIIIDSGIQIIDGIELSAKSQKGRMHILGFDIDLDNQELNDKMSMLRDNSVNATLSVMEQIKRDYGIVFGYEDIKNLINANHNIGRPDLARLCIKYGYSNTVQEAFDKYLIEAHNKTRSTSKGLPYQECLELITKSNGIPILAHPKTLELSEKELLILIREMINYGLMGIEVYHSSHTKEETELYLSIAKKFNLLISGGTDYHGPIVKPNIELGTGENNNIHIKSLSLLKYINKR